jgi:hypothetical protein
MAFKGGSLELHMSCVVEAPVAAIKLLLSLKTSSANSKSVGHSSRDADRHKMSLADSCILSIITVIFVVNQQQIDQTYQIERGKRSFE